ncbi:hypothetical protein [Nonomuraea sediminis]|uniref:hypothetical protein n=1 Tax=Nonomuraea sediminis TaxID=2835864 RepID=UPI001BDCDCC7|nr:hypothetical protein [Nonomuraea sediminis]
MKKRIGGVVGRMVMAVMLPAIVGCAAGANEAPSDRVTIKGSDPRILVHYHNNFGMQALLTGRLTFEPTNKCLVLKDARESPSHEVVIPLWPQDTRPLIENGKRGVRLGNGTILLEGSKVKIAGGFVDWNKSTPPGLKVPNDCIGDLASSVIFEVNPLAPGG